MQWGTNWYFPNALYIGCPSTLTIMYWTETKSANYIIIKLFSRAGTQRRESMKITPKQEWKHQHQPLYGFFHHNISTSWEANRCQGEIWKKAHRLACFGINSMLPLNANVEESRFVPSSSFRAPLGKQISTWYANGEWHFHREFPVHFTLLHSTIEHHIGISHVKNGLTTCITPWMDLDKQTVDGTQPVTSHSCWLWHFRCAILLHHV